ncbi:MAG TPA: LamG domain-containing protein, partial [Bacteroidia bacterium]|nr:LamG domain-containing protein [Bacteroidia bacterium]
MKKAISLCSLLFSITLFAQIPAYVPLSGLLAYYPFNGNANDATINLHNGTVIGATPSADRFGNPNSAYLFNGTSNYITVPNAAPLCLSNTDFTISVWINQANLVSYEEAIISKRTTASQSGYMFNIEGPSQTIPGVTNFIVSGGFDPRAYSNTPITLNTWHHILILYTLNNQTITTYIDGAINSVVTGMPSPSGTGTSNIFIGNDAAGNPYYYHGNIDDIGMWNRALT